MGRWLRIVRRALRRFNDQKMGDAAAALTYYALMSLLPLLLVATSVFALFGDREAVGGFVDYIVEHGADRSTARAVRDLMVRITQASSEAAGLTLVVSLVLALNSASGAFGAAGRALNDVEQVEEQRGFVRRRLTDAAIALCVAGLLALALTAVLLGGGVSRDAFDAIGLGGAAADAWAVVRWPVALVAAIASCALIYTFAPDREPLRPRVFTVGTVAAVAIWMLGSVGFAVYVQNFSNYGAAYGTFGGLIVLLLWLWLSSCAFLLGAQLDQALAHDDLPDGMARGDPLRRRK